MDYLAGALGRPSVKHLQSPHSDLTLVLPQIPLAFLPAISRPHARQNILGIEERGLPNEGPCCVTQQTKGLERRDASHRFDPSRHGVRLNTVVTIEVLTLAPFSQVACSRLPFSYLSYVVPTVVDRNCTSAGALNKAERLAAH